MCCSPVVATVPAGKNGQDATFVLRSCGALMIRYPGAEGVFWTRISNWSAGDPAGHVAALIGTEGWTAAAS